MYAKPSGTIMMLCDSSPFHAPYPFKSVKHSVTINNHIAFYRSIVLLVFLCASVCLQQLVYVKFMNKFLTTFFSVPFVCLLDYLRCIKWSHATSFKIIYKHTHTHPNAKNGRMNKQCGSVRT